MATATPDRSSFWAAMALKAEEPVNEEVWARSPGLALHLHGGNMLRNASDIGGEQSMIDDLDVPLPWVTDLVGTDSEDATSILVCGSSVAPCIRGLAQRRNGIKLSSYIDAHSSASFQNAFMEEVVVPDCAYYGKLAAMLDGYVSPSQLIVTDLCRASFCRRGTRPMRVSDSLDLDYYDAGGDKIACDSPAVFRSYTESDDVDRLNWRRISEFKGNRIIALGMLAEHGLLRLLSRHGATTIHRHKHASSRWRFKREEDWPRNRPAHTGFPISYWLAADDWWVVHWEQRTCHILPVPHPAYVYSPVAEYGPVRAVLPLMRDLPPYPKTGACPRCL